MACDTLATKDPDLEDEEQETHVYEKHDRLLHGERKERKEKIVSLEFMRKYIHVAKAIKPSLTRQAAEMIANQYSELRDQENISNDKAKTMPVTARTLETMIRLSTAHAKARLSKTIDVVDAKAAIDMVSFAYFHKIVKKDKRKRKASDIDSDESDEDEESGEDGDTQESGSSKTPKRESKRRRKPKRKEGEEADPFDFEDEDDSERPRDVLDQMRQRRTKSVEESQEPETMETESTATDETPAEPLPKERLGKFKSLLQGAFASAHVQSLSMDDVKRAVNKDKEEAQFTNVEIRAALHAMEEANHLMVSNERVFLI